MGEDPSLGYDLTSFDITSLARGDGQREQAS